MPATVPPPADSDEKRAARFEAFREAVEEAARWYAGGLPPDRAWPS